MFPLQQREETAAQLRAFEDYWALGYDRSLEKLAGLYRDQSASGQGIPTKRLATLKDWSRDHGWLRRCADREAKLALERRAKLKERADKFRDRLLRAIEIEGSAYAQQVYARVGPNGELSGPVLIGDANSLDKVTRLYFQLAEQPLADKHEVSGKVTAEVHEEFGPEAFVDNPAAMDAAFALAAALNPGPDEANAAPGEHWQS
jgi:GNAT superfamily N-acetyltransferase